MSFAEAAPQEEIQRPNDWQIDTSMFPEAATMSSEGLEEAARAFFEKRRPQFKGR